MTYRTHYESPFGILTLTSDGDSLKELRFTDNPVEVMLPTIPVLEETQRWLDCYFNREAPGFTPRVAPFGTLFQRRVWSELLSIPYGETVTYGDIARRIDCKSAQAVGSAVGRNPIAIIIPCHRVIGTDGSLTGYAYGIERKRRLLMLEKNAHQYGKQS